MSVKRSDKKRELILTKAKQVFISKGFTSVTMKDIIEECGISRGGIYLYFQSVDEIFIQVILSQNKKKSIRAKCFTQGKSFRELVDEYFDKQKKRLLNMQNSLLMAMYEYRFLHKDDKDKEFFHGQFVYTKSIILELLEYGVSQGEISANKIDNLAENIIFLIEGISTLAVSTGISEETVDSQIQFVKEIIFINR